MSSGVIDEQERAELEAAEKGSRLIRPSTYKRETHLSRLTPEEYAQVDAWTIENYIKHEEYHERIHKATVEYLIRKAQEKRVSQKQLASEYKVGARQISWRLAIYRGFDKAKYDREYNRRRLELEAQKEAQIRASGKYASVLKYDHFIAELDRMIRNLEELLTEANAIEAHLRASETLIDIIGLFDSQFGRDDLTEVLYEIIDDIYGDIVSRLERERPICTLYSNQGVFWELRYTPAQKHKYFLWRVQLRKQNMLNWLKEADIWQAYINAGNELNRLISLLTFQLQDQALVSREKSVTSLFEAITKKTNLVQQRRR